MEESQISFILNLLEMKRGFDFSGYRTAMIERRIYKRTYATNCSNLSGYVDYLNSHPGELDNLIDAFTINVSKFFRNPLPFEYISGVLIPELLSVDENEKNRTLRIWSAGCSFGEEPYSLAMIMSEAIQKEENPPDLKIFATDIDTKALAGAMKGRYRLKSVEEVKFGFIEKYFSREGEYYAVADEIKEKVQFSFYNLLDKNSFVPPESIYGNFDLVMCRNVLIYFNPGYQQIIFEKLYKSLKPNGFLVLGESETPVNGFRDKFHRHNNFVKIYRKSELKGMNG